MNHPPQIEGTVANRNLNGGYNSRLLVTLLLSLAVFLFLLAMFDKKFRASETDKLQEQASQRLSVYQNSLLTSIEQYEFLPAVLSTDPRILHALTEGSAVSESSPLLSQTNDRAGSDEIFLMNKDGLTIGSSNYLSNTSFVNQNYAFRPYFKIAIEGGLGVYFAVGATSGKAGLFLAEAVYVDGVVTGVIVVKISLAALENSWVQSGEKVWLSDELGIVFLSYDARWQYLGLRPLSLKDQKLVAETKQYGTEEIELFAIKDDNSKYSSVELKGESEHILFQQDIQGLGWKISWLYSKAEFTKAINLKKIYLFSLYVFMIISGLWVRERIKSAQTQKHISQLIQQSEEHQRAIIENTDAGLIVLRNDGITTFINPQAKLLFRLEDDSLPDIQLLISPWRGIHATVRPTDATGLRTDGTKVPILVSTSAIGTTGEHEYLVTIHDVSELKSAQLNLLKSNDALEQRVISRTEELRQAENELNQSQRLASLGRMSSAIAHEINQPITALSSYAASSELLLHRNDHEKVAINLTKIKGLIERLSYISRQLRMVSGKRNTGLSTIRILPVVQYALDVLKTKTEQLKVKVEIDIGEFDEAQGNSMMLEQVVVNLVSNALDAVISKTVREIYIRSRHGSGLRLSIEDTGQGLNPDDLPHIFEPFYSTKDMGEGLGLGLAISYSLVTDMGGKLTVSSQVGNGSLFNIDLLSSSINVKNNTTESFVFDTTDTTDTTEVASKLLGNRVEK
ncbi:ATP-binding protein [Reinekea forsetii]|uniref:histidine kinase n=1 Tax=Reinekea forsetii TaxID=1336806 RepID=A0A2K8KSI8_9GAMM|nr:ATP-binding protein [Reinekea forsetii]ATX77688.1 C4-dicarboxylate transport sensor protein DctB [Reinekea forsetii]